MALVERLVSTYASGDSAGTAVKVARRLMHVLFETNNAFWFERSLEDELPRITPRIRVETSFAANRETIGWIREQGEPWMYNEREIETGMKAGHYYGNVRHDGKIIGYAKVAVRRVYIHDYRKVLDLPDDYAFIYDTYVVPGYRGLKIASSLVADIMRFLKGSGYGRLGCHIPPWNVASINTYAALGFRKTRYIRFMRIAGIRAFTASPEIV